VGVEVVPGKPSVCLSLLVSLSPAQLHSAGRVAAGAIAEKYLKLAYGIEIIAFVSSVGKVHLPSSMAPPSLTPINPDEEDDSAHDALSKDFVTLLGTISREEVDKHPTRCPHPETAERMTKVGHSSLDHNLILTRTLPENHSCQKCPRFYRWYCHLRHSERSIWSWGARFRQIRSLSCACDVVHSSNEGLRDRFWIQGYRSPR